MPKDSAENQKVFDWVDRKLLHSFGDDNGADETLTTVKRHARHSVATENERNFDTSLAREFNNLSIEKRGRHLEEIHGVATIPEENPAFLDEHLRKLHRLLDETPNKPLAYTLALEQNQAYIRSRLFGLMFLRAELFDVPKAVKRLLFVLQKKLEFFGEQTLTRDLRLSDLPEDAQHALENGSFQLLPFRDRSGRIIFIEFMFTGDREYRHVKDFVSVFKARYSCLT